MNFASDKFLSIQTVPIKSRLNCVIRKVLTPTLPSVIQLNLD